MSTFNANNYDHVCSVADFIKDRIGVNNGALKTPEVLIICGSGLSEMANQVQNAVKINYKDIPNFPVGNVPGHKEFLLFGTLEGKNVMCMQVRIAKVLGATTLLMTSAVSAINRTYKVGDLVTVKDHMFVPGNALNSSLLGPNDERFGPRFIGATSMYDVELRKLAKKVAAAHNTTLHEGVYVMTGGPHFESAAEIRWFSKCGCDVVGMSVCHETVVARHCGIRVLAIALITNLAPHDCDQRPSEAPHDEVLQIGEQPAHRTIQLLKDILAQL